MAVVKVPTVTDMALATVDIFFGSSSPMASMMCMSLIEISLKLPEISALFSMSMISLNNMTRRPFKTSSFFTPSPRLQFAVPVHSVHSRQ